MSNKNNDFKHIGYCGRDCYNCQTYTDKQCYSCKVNASPNAECSIVRCALKKNVLTCAHCNELNTCDNSKWKDPEYIKTLEKFMKSLNCN